MDRKAAEALRIGAVLVDRSSWGRLRVSGEDRLRFLHGQSTASFLALQPGQGCETVRASSPGSRAADQCRLPTVICT